MSREVYETPKLNHGMLLAGIGGFCVTAAILLVLPLTQWISESFQRPESKREVTVVREPPQPPPPESPAKEHQQKTDNPELTPRPERLNLTQLEIAIRPGMGDMDAGDLSVNGFSLSPDAVAEMQIFDVADLDRIPQPVSYPKFVLPRELERQGIRGNVRLVVLITPEGKVHVAGVEATDHPRLVKYARNFAERIRYESPMRNGKKVTTKFILPLRY